MVTNDMSIGRTWGRLILPGLALLLVGCSPIKVSLDYDPQVRFSRFATFDWLDNRPNVPNRVKVVVSQDSVVNECVRDEVPHALVAKGLTRDQVNPDLLIMYYVGADEDIDVKTYGYEYSARYEGLGSPVDVSAYRKGTLIVDLISADTLELVWRGAAQRTRLEQSTPDEIRARVHEAVKTMFKAYPPVS
jgi:hypothetical protein